MPTARPYQRLPGQKRKTLGRDTLWLGPDHLLLMVSSGMSEHYRRFYYTDIKSLVVSKTTTARTKTLFVFAVFAICLIAGAVLFKLDHAVQVFFWVTAPVFLLYGLFCLAAGPSCACWIITAVGREKLSPAHRMRPTLSMIARLRDRIVEAQGTLTPEVLAHLADADPSVRKQLSAVDPDDLPRREETGAWHLALYLMLIMLSVMSGITLFYRPYLLVIAATLLFAAMAIASITALVRQKDSGLSPSVRHSAWAGLGLVVLGFIQSYAETMFLVFQRAGQDKGPLDQLTLLRLHTRMDPFDYPVFLTLDIIGIIAFALVGIWGLWALRRRRTV
ncbi:hypothetical protein JCM14469_25210 [Desulfatiferula olefinivorans]